MNILLTARQPGGGIKTFFRYIYGHEAFASANFTLVAPDEGLSTYLRKCLPEGRLKLIPVKHSNKELFKTCRKVLSSGSFQLLHSHGFSAGVVSECARAGTGLPHLMTAHDVFRPEQFNGVKGWFKKHALNSIYNRLDMIHTVTEDARENLLEYMPRLKQARVHNILHGVDTAYFAEGQTHDLRKSLNLALDRPLVGFFGRFMAQKGFRTLVDAIGMLKNKGMPENRLPMVLTFGWGGYIREDYQYLEQKGLSAYFHQMPATDAMPDMLASMDMVAMPSRWEACGLLAMEALAAGVPLIATDCVGLREVLEGTPARLVTPQDSSALAAEIAAEINKPTRQQFQAYQPTAVERFAIDRPARELFKLYEAVAKP